MRRVANAVAVILVAAAAITAMRLTRDEAAAPAPSVLRAAPPNIPEVASRPAEPIPGITTARAAFAVTGSVAPAEAKVLSEPPPAPSYRVRPRVAKTDLTEAASDDDGMQATVESPAAPVPLKAIPAPPPGPDPGVNPAVRDPNAIYKGEGARDDDGG